MSKSKRRIIVVEDDTILLDSYKYYLDSYKNYCLTGSYSNIYDALDDFQNSRPDIIISDITMPGVNGVDGIKKFKELNDTVKIILISVHDDIEYVVNSIENKVDGYLTKPINKESLLNALDSIKTGGVPLTPNISKLIINLLVNEKKGIFDKNKIFSEREIEILKLFTTGHTYKSIAENLFISHSTVNFHIQNIYNKLDVNNKSDALDKLYKVKF